MKARYRLFQRGTVFYAEDAETGKQGSLRTTNAREAAHLLAAKNEAHQHPQLNFQLARTYLLGSDAQIGTRTWADVMAEAAKLKQGQTKLRWERGVRQKPFDLIRNRLLIDTRAEHFISVLAGGTVATNTFLRRLHNLALDMNWLPVAVLPRRQWPKIQFKEKRGITAAEHQKILADERNLEWKSYYELLWHLGGAQSDIAGLQAADLDWGDKTISYRRMKTKAPVIVRFSDSVGAILQNLSKDGPLFPMLCDWPETDRAKAFIRRCKRVGITGVSLH